MPNIIYVYYGLKYNDYRAIDMDIDEKIGFPVYA